MRIEKAIDLLRDALEGEPFDKEGNRDDTGLLFACQMGWVRKEHRMNVHKVLEALETLQEEHDRD